MAKFIKIKEIGSAAEVVINCDEIISIVDSREPILRNGTETNMDLDVSIYKGPLYDELRRLIKKGELYYIITFSVGKERYCSFEEIKKVYDAIDLEM